MGRNRVTLSSLSQTTAYAQELSLQLKPNDIVLLTGPLGAGKTAFIQGLARGLGSLDLVQSPTYVYLQIYEARLFLFHFDLYRFNSSSDFLAMGFDEYFQGGGITAIEWPERIADLLPPHALHIDLQPLSEHERTATIGSWGDR